MANSKDELSDITIVQNSDGIRSVCSTWQGAVNSADLSSIDVTSIFAPLVENGIAVSYVSSLKTALANITSMVSKLISAIGSTVDAQEEIDDKGKNGADKSRGSNYRNYGGGGASGAGTPINTGGGYDIKDPESKLDILKKFDDYVSKLDEYKKLELMTGLYSIIKADVKECLYNEKYAASLKKKILNSPKVDANIRKIIAQLDENEVQVLLQNILVNNTEISDFSQMIISIYDNQFKQEFSGAAGPSYEHNLVNSPSSIESITKVYTFLSKEKDAQGYLSKIYFGDVSNVDDSTISFTRVLVDTLAEKSGISYDELLSDSRYGDALKEATVDIAKSFTTLSIQSNFYDQHN